MTSTTRSVRSTAGQSHTSRAPPDTRYPPHLRRAFTAPASRGHPAGIPPTPREGVSRVRGAPETGNVRARDGLLVSGHRDRRVVGGEGSENGMHSTRVLGVVALVAILVAAVSFAVVDVSISDGCAAGPCNNGIPVVAITFAALGGLAALVSVIPAVTWIVEAVRSARHSHDELDRELARVHRPTRAPFDDEEL